MLDGATNDVQVRLSQCSPGYMRVAFDKWAIANTKRLANASLPPDVEIAAPLAH